MLQLKELRKQEKISQEALAKELGVSRSTIAMWERGTNPGTEMLEKLARRFRVSMNTLMGIPEVITENGGSLYELDENEKTLVNIFRNLNKEGKREALNYANYLSLQSVYKEERSCPFCPCFMTLSDVGIRVGFSLRR